MLTFNKLLMDVGISPTTVHLVRHQDSRSTTGNGVFELWRNDKAAFHLYQSIQKRAVFRVGNFLATFVVTPRRQTMFVGMHLVQEMGVARAGLRDPLLGHDVSGLHQYKLLPDERLASYAERLCIDWGQGFRSWVQRAGRQDKTITELMLRYEDEPFPGYLRLILRLSEVSALPSDWRERLTEAKGVYLLTCPRTCEHYVGSASGEGGFFQRWLEHAAMRGDAVHFRSREPADYQVSILEVAGSSALERDVRSAESLWMQKLQSMAMGLNGPVRPVEASSGS